VQQNLNKKETLSICFSRAVQRTNNKIEHQSRLSSTIVLLAFTSFVAFNNLVSLPSLLVLSPCLLAVANRPGVLLYFCANDSLLLLPLLLACSLLLFSDNGRMLLLLLLPGKWRRSGSCKKWKSVKRLAGWRMKCYGKPCDPFQLPFYRNPKASGGSEKKGKSFGWARVGGSGSEKSTAAASEKRAGKGKMEMKESVVRWNWNDDAT